MPAIRHAGPEDASAIAAIWNPLIRDSAITFTSAERSGAEIAAMMAERRGRGLPWLVAETENGLAGFATFAPFRNGPGYARTMEHTIVLAEAATRRGLGARLLAGLVEAARPLEVHSLVAGISAENPRALAFHAAQGFREAGRVTQAGFKFGRWIDLVLMQRMLG